MTKQYDFNDVENEGEGFDLIPQGTLAKVILRIEPGGHNDAEKGWSGGIVTYNSKTGSCYLKCEFTIMGGKYDKRKIFSLIGLYSPKGETWGEIGRKFIKGILDSAHGYKSMDMSDEAKSARKIENYHDLNGLIFVAKISVSTDLEGIKRNEIRQAIPPEFAVYKGLMFPDQIMTDNLFNGKMPLKSSPFDDERGRVLLDDEIPF